MADQVATPNQKDEDGRSLGDRQALLVDCLALLFRYARECGYQLRLGEGYVKPCRKDRAGVVHDDGEHMAASLHYLKLAQDLDLFVRSAEGWKYVTDGDHPAWRDLGEYWERLDPLCRWGGRFRSRDSNHVSIAYQGRA